MPQLNTSTWFITILSMILTLFIIMQLKISKHHYYSNPAPTSMKMLKQSTPWDNKWTKICLSHSLPLR